MKIQQLLLVAIIVLCQTNVINAAQDTNQKKVDYLQTKKIPNSIQNGCIQNPIRECAKLNDYLEAAEQHRIKQKKNLEEADQRIKQKYGIDIRSAIASLEDQKKELQQKGARHPFVNELIEKDLKDGQEFLTNCNKKYLDTLTPEEYKEFKSVVQAVVWEYVHLSVHNIAYELIAKALEE